MATQRENLKRHIRENLSNDAIAKKFNVHIRTVEKIMALKTWSNI
jgi:transposase